MPFQLTDTMQEIVDAQLRLGARPIHTLEPTAARENVTPTDAVIAVTKDKTGTFEPAPVGEIEERRIPGPAPDGTLVRIYHPKLPIVEKAKEAVGAGDGHPVIVYVHGGGWVIADLDVYDGTPRALANLARAIVVSVEYRKGPEDPYPAAHDDVLAATRWVMANAAEFGGDPSRVAIAGESAGGNMATSTCLELIKAGEPTPVFQLLVYPVTDFVGKDWPSYDEAKGAVPVSTEDIEWFGGYAVPEGQESDPRLSILRADDELLRRLPPTQVVLAEADPLRSQGEAFAEKLHGLGVRVRLQPYRGVTHEFFGMAPLLPEADRAQAVAAEDLRAAFDGELAGQKSAT